MVDLLLRGSAIHPLRLLTRPWVAATFGALSLSLAAFAGLLVVRVGLGDSRADWAIRLFVLVMLVGAKDAFKLSLVSKGRIPQDALAPRVAGTLSRRVTELILPFVAVMTIVALTVRGSSHTDQTLPWPLIADHLLRVSESGFWDLSAMAVCAQQIFVVHLTWIEQRRVSLTQKFYMELATWSKTGQAQSEERFLESILANVIQRMTLGALSKFSMSSPLSNAYQALLFIPMPDKRRFEVVASQRAGSGLAFVNSTPMKELIRPSLLRVNELAMLTEKCCGEKELRSFKYDDFESARDDYLSEVGVVYELEKPRIFHHTAQCLALSVSWRAFVRNSYEMRYRSIASIPIKTCTHTLGVLVVGSKLPFGFVGLDRPLMERIGRELAEAVVVSHVHRASTTDIRALGRPVHTKQSKQAVARILRAVTKTYITGDKGAIEREIERERARKEPEQTSRGRS